MTSPPSIDAFVSIVLPVYEERTWDTHRLGELAQSSTALFPVHEIIVVVPNGTGSLVQEALELAREFPSVQVFCIGSRSTPELVATAGLDQAIGDVVVLLDSVADDPEAIAAAARQVTASPSISIYGANESARPARVATPLGRWAGSVFASLLDRTSGIRVPITEPGFRVVSRATLNHWLDRDDRDRMLAVMPVLGGSRTAVVRYRGEARSASQDPLIHDFRVGLRTLMSVSPLLPRLGWALAVLGSLLSLAYSIAVVIIAVAKGDVVEGWVSLSLLSSGMFFLLSLVLALLCEYVLRLDRRSGGPRLYRIERESASPSLEVLGRLNIDDSSAASDIDVQSSGDAADRL